MLDSSSLLTFDDSSTPTSRPNTTSKAKTTQPKKTLNADWRSRIQPLQSDNLLGTVSPSASKTASTSKVKGKKAAKGKSRKVKESDDDEDYPVTDVLIEKKSGIEDEVVERFPKEGTAGLDQVCELLIFASSTSLIVFSASSRSIYLT